MCLDDLLDDFVGEPVDTLEVSQQLCLVCEAAGALERTLEHLLDLVSLLSPNLVGVTVLPMLLRYMFIKYMGVFLS